MYHRKPPEPPPSDDAASGNLPLAKPFCVTTYSLNHHQSTGHQHKSYHGMYLLNHHHNMQRQVLKHNLKHNLSAISNTKQDKETTAQEALTSSYVKELQQSASTTGNLPNLRLFHYRRPVMNYDSYDSNLMGYYYR